MGNARDTGYLQNIVTYDANDNIVLPADLSIGGSSGFYWDNTNKRLGIGTNVPAAPITIQGSSSDGVAIFRDTTSLNTGTGGSIRFEGQTTTGGGFTTGLGVILGGKENATSGNFASYLGFQTRINGGSLTERWRITSTGILQSNGAQTIQTSTGNLTLTSVDNTGIVDVRRNNRALGAELRITNAFSGTGYQIGDIVGTLNFVTADDSTTPIRAQIQAISTGGSTYPAAIQLTFSTASLNTLTEGFRLTNLGNLHIGTFTSDNGARLQVSGKLTVTHSSTDFVTEIINTASTNPYGLRVKDASGAANNYPLFSVSNNAGSVEYFRVNSGTGAATFSSTIEIAENTWINASSINLIRSSVFGYSSSYKTTQLGALGSTRAISLGVDLTGNPSGNFSGNEIVLPNDKGIIAPNAANNDYIGVLRVTSSNGLNIGGNYTVNGWINILSNGNVGIGATSPGVKLDVAGRIRSYASTGEIYAYSTDANNTATVFAGWQGGVGMSMKYHPNIAVGYIENGYEATAGQVFGDIHIRQNVSGTMTTRMFIKADGGNIGIGRQDPQYRLDIYRPGASGVRVNTIGSSFGSPSLVVGDASSGMEGIFTVASGGVEFGSYSNNDIIFKRNQAERARITANGLTFNGDTAAANALDDYEEGTVDITYLTDGVATFTQQAGFRHLSYTKIGNRVFVSGNIYNLSISGTWTNPLRIPLPFTGASSDGRARSTAHAALYNWGTSDNIFKIEYLGATYAELVSAGNGGAWDTITTSAGFTVIVNFSYITNV